MLNISEIDKALKVDAEIEKDGLIFYDVMNAPFRIYGVYFEDGKFRRLPEMVAKSVNEGVHGLHANTAGGRVRFRTDSKRVAIIAQMGSVGKMSHFALTGSAGFDLYADNEYYKSFVPPFNLNDGYESVVEFTDSEMREITINFPLYSEVKSLYIGVKENASLEEPTPYKVKCPVVYYGSSITQGGCASRPGSSYQAIISRRFDCNYINLGFSGSARAEDEIIEYIKSLDMSVFVYDYDHNAPTVEHLRETHEKMFKAIRKEKPNLSIIMMSRPKHILTEEETERRAIIEKTYTNAVKEGDKNVYFIDGAALTRLCGNEGTVDGCHPTDFGFASMAKALGDLMKENNLI